MAYDRVAVLLRRRLPPIAVAVAGSAALLGSVGVAAAQSGGGTVNLQQFRPAPSSDRGFQLDGTGVLPHYKLRAALEVNYGADPLILEDRVRAQSFEAVGGSLAADLLLSVGLFGRLEVGAALPLTLHQSGEPPPGSRPMPAARGLGDTRLGFKARVWGDGGPGAGLAAAVLVTLPRGAGGDGLMNEAGATVEPRVIADLRRPRWVAAVRTGYRIRENATLHDIALGDELTFAAGGQLGLGPLTRVIVEAAAATPAGSPFATRAQTPAEALLGVRRRVGPTFITVAGGPGLVSGYGSPAYRVIAAVAWTDVVPDSDGDGLADDADLCPNDPEDRDGFQDADGCPDADNDADGVKDDADACPAVSEDRDGFQDGDGCPEPDNDGDGILDAVDKCPDKRETVNKWQDEDGCPDQLPPPADTDGDGLTDDKDRCPAEAEDKDGWQDDDGCPDPDNDGDGILDAADKCPGEAETINGNQDEDGCPDSGEVQVRIGKKELEVLKPIFFDTDRSRVRHAFHDILGQIAATLKAHPEIGRCAVEGHADAVGPPDWNQKLSLLRAEAVVEFLAEKGVDRARLTAIGQAAVMPWAPNETPEGRAKNRRVIFHIEGAAARAP